MLTLLQQVHLGGRLDQPRNLLLRYVTSQIRHPRVGFRRVLLAESKHKRQPY
jgi:hypothetical protein